MGRLPHARTASVRSDVNENAPGIGGVFHGCPGEVHSGQDDDARGRPRCILGGQSTHPWRRGGRPTLSGELDYWVDGVHYRLQPGDCVSFDSSVSHRYSNPGNVPAVCAWTETPRGF
ncbi:cupin domain-containing protein [Streptomyces sp. NPDC020792]|uniref:cupin domain-containing protein n=1 Tax=Streptomyces sp. NPDC020792 TaxID=3365089 RepID=UPI0037963EEC